MSLWFGLVLAGLAVQRITELAIANKNTRWALSRGGCETGREHYPLIVGVHLLFFIGLFLEAGIGESRPPSWCWIPFSLFLAAQGLRLWCLRSLGPCWNTRILVIPGHPLVVHGPYRWMRHPNYVVVATEIFTLPLTFGAWMTALSVTLLNAFVLLAVRIPAEEGALRAAAACEEAMGRRSRFLPRPVKGPEKT